MVDSRCEIQSKTHECVSKWHLESNKYSRNYKINVVNLIYQNSDSIRSSLQLKYNGFMGLIPIELILLYQFYDHHPFISSISLVFLVSFKYHIWIGLHHRLTKSTSIGIQLRYLVQVDCCSWYMGFCNAASNAFKHPESDH